MNENGMKRRTLNNLPVILDDQVQAEAKNKNLSVNDKVLFSAIKADAQSAGITFCAYGLASDLYRFTPPQAKYIDIQPGHNEHRTEKLQTR